MKAPSTEIVSAPHSFSPEAVVAALETDGHQGLTTEEVQRRQARFGPNALPQDSSPGWGRRLLRQFQSFLILLLLAAALISLTIGEALDAGAIMVVVLLNASLGLAQEWRAERSLELLRSLAAPRARAWRNGYRQEIAATELVPGDLVHLEAGSRVPADLRLLEAASLRLDEASLTGESLPTDKDANIVLPLETPMADWDNCVFMGTAVVHGRGLGIVTATGRQTQLGRIAGMLAGGGEPPTPLQRSLDRLGHQLGLAVIIICALVLALGWLRGLGVGILVVAISLAVAAVPEGLPVVSTIVLALGMERMARHRALVRHLFAVEALGAVTVICSDKTGTITQGEMTVRRLWVEGEELEVSGEGYSPRGQILSQGKAVEISPQSALGWLLRAAVLCNDAILGPVGSGSRPSGDPTEVALLVLGAKAGLERHHEEAEWPRLAETPFSSQQRFMATLHRHQDRGSVLFVKGAPDVVLRRCQYWQGQSEALPFSAEDRARVPKMAEALAGAALRVLALAYHPRPRGLGDAEGELVFLGLVGMQDPPRPEVKEAVLKAKRAGVASVMVTGDHKATAVAIAQEVGLMRAQDLALEGSELESLADWDEALRRARVYARISPEQKVAIVEGLRRQGEVVAVTGDGVNDAPALKRADIGVTMGRVGTDVAREAADLILTDDNFATIVTAVEQGRIIYSNIQKFVFYLLCCNLAEILVIVAAMVAGLPVPLTPLQILWINLITDTFPALALGLERGEPNLMGQPPRPRQEPIITPSLTRRVAIQSVIITAAIVAAFVIGLSWGELHLAQTMAFATLTMEELVRAHPSRSLRRPLPSLGLFTNPFAIGATLIGATLLGIAIFLPHLQPVFGTVALEANEMALAVGLAVLPSLWAEASKKLFPA